MSESQITVAVNPDGQVMCAAFAACESPAEGVIAHPVLEYVPACERCARCLLVPLIPATFVIGSEAKQ